MCPCSPAPNQAYWACHYRKVIVIFSANLVISLLPDIHIFCILYYIISTNSKELSVEVG